MAENETVVIGGPYKESDDHVPDPTDQYDQFNTSGTGSHQVIEDVSPIFQVAKTAAVQQAAHALDPDHPEPRSSLVMPTAQRVETVDEGAIRDEITAKAEKAGPVEVGGPSPSEEAAAETGEVGEVSANTETQSQGSDGSSPATTPDETGETPTSTEVDAEHSPFTADPTSDAVEPGEPTHAVPTTESPTGVTTTGDAPSRAEDTGTTTDTGAMSGEPDVEPFTPTTVVGGDPTDATASTDTLDAAASADTTATTDTGVAAGTTTTDEQHSGL